MTQTMTSWIFEQMKNGNFESYTTRKAWHINQPADKNILAIAKKMEKDIIKQAYEEGYANATDVFKFNDENLKCTSEEYYNETFL